jgi:hypothetical protein
MKEPLPATSLSIALDTRSCGGALSNPWIIGDVESPLLA